MTPLTEHCRNYLAGRTATYEMRRKRFIMVERILGLYLNMGPEDVLYDLGAGHCQFDYYLRRECDWKGAYVPIDGALDGTDLNTWKPKVQPDIYVAMEVIEHLWNPLELLAKLEPVKGVVLTTPNPDAVDVLACDQDHSSEVHASELQAMGYIVVARECFGTPNDTLIAWRRTE